MNSENLIYLSYTKNNPSLIVFRSEQYSTLNSLHAEIFKYELLEKALKDSEVDYLSKNNREEPFVEELRYWAGTEILYWLEARTDLTVIGLFQLLQHWGIDFHNVQIPPHAFKEN